MARPARITSRLSTRRLTRRGGFQPRTILVIAIAWMLMWDKLTWGNAINGFLVGLVITVIFPLPSVEYHGRPRLFRTAFLIVQFMFELARAAVHVSILALRPAAPPKGSIIEVQLKTRSDLYLTIVAVMTVLVPGSVVVEVRRSAGILYVHDVDARDPKSLEERRQAVLTTERRLVRAVGSKEEIALVMGEAS